MKSQSKFEHSFLAVLLYLWKTRRVASFSQAIVDEFEWRISLNCECVCVCVRNFTRVVAGENRLNESNKNEVLKNVWMVGEMERKEKLVKNPS